MTVSLSGAGSSLNEVVVIGYGTSRKKDLTGAVTAITAKDFNKGSITTPEQLIAVKLPACKLHPMVVRRVQEVQFAFVAVLRLMQVMTPDRR
jgi:hypothetical protein